MIRKFHYLNVVKTLSDKSDEKKLGGLQAGYLVSFDKKKNTKTISPIFLSLLSLYLLQTLKPKSRDASAPAPPFTHIIVFFSFCDVKEKALIVDKDAPSSGKPINVSA